MLKFIMKTKICLNKIFKKLNLNKNLKNIIFVGKELKKINQIMTIFKLYLLSSNFI